jgi:hypothetical protein
LERTGNSEAKAIGICSKESRFLQTPEWVEKYYRRACRDAAKETKKLVETFPTECPYTIEQILDSDFFA